MHHDVVLFLLSLAVLLGAARLLGEVSARFGFPAVVGEIVAGIVVGRTVLGRIAPEAFAWLFPGGAAETLLSAYTTVAVVLLLVIAGLEIDLTVVRKSGRVVVLTALPGMLLPLALGFGVGLLLPDRHLADPSLRTLHAAFLGIALSISALPVIARTLLDLGLMKTDFGLLVLSGAVVNDLFGWIAFSVLSRELNAGGGGPGRTGVAVGLTLALVIATLVVVRPLVDRALARLEEPQEASGGRVLSMIMVLALLGAAATEALGLHAVFGAFIMGIAVGDSRRLREHTRQVLHEFVTSVFTPVFFATMALRLDFAAAFDPLLCALIVGVACVAKVAGCAAGARAAGLGWREAAAVGFGLNSRGAMEILLAVIALRAGIINQPLFVALVSMAIITSLISGPAMARLLRPTLGPIASMLRAGAVRLDLAAASRDAAIAELTSALAARLGRPDDARRFAEAVLRREELAGTGVGDGVAFPHAEVEGLTDPALAFGRSRAGLDFDAPDGEPARLVFLLLTPPREFDRELKLLAELARLLTRDEVRRGLLDAPDERAALACVDAVDRTPLGAAAPPQSA
ncbi:MAG: cation:proton antiporter [Polyangiaceae bacterium]|nr:cation:proton antiporter [Polyangiaceae bacterium]